MSVESSNEVRSGVIFNVEISHEEEDMGLVYVIDSCFHLIFVEFNV